MFHSLKRVKILIVDDRPANLVALEAVLGADYELIEAHSGPEALERLQSHPDVAVVLLDVQMPGMDGFETAKLIKENPAFRDLPIIFITAIYKEDPFIKKGFEAGAVDYFSKPFDPEILKMKVEIYAAFRQKQQLLQEREERLRASEKLLRAGRRLNEVLEQLQVGVIISDVEGRICQTNEAASRIFKVQQAAAADAYGEILGWWDHQGHLIKEQEGPLFKALTQGESSHNEVLKIECLDGSDKTLLGSASLLRTLQGQIVGAVVVIQDVTEPKKIEEDLEQRILELVSLGIRVEHAAES